MFQHTIPMVVVKNNVVKNNVVLPKFPIMYLPHAFKIFNEDFGIECEPWIIIQQIVKL
jgi:hypothetical protein